MSRKGIYTPENTFQSMIEDDEVTSKYQHKINYGRAKIKIHDKVDETPEHTIEFPNSCSLTLLPDLPHNVINKLDDYRLNYGPLEYETSGSKFKESYILPFRPPWNEIDYIVSSSYDVSGSIAFATQSNGDIIVLGDDDKNGIIQEEYCKIQVPFLVDASGSRTDANLEITTKKIQGKDKDIFRYSVDPTWLDNAVYPVVIDPSILLYTTTNVVAMYYPLQPMITRAANGNLVAIHGERTTWRLRVIIGQGDSFATSSFATIVTGTTYLDYQNIVTADNGDLVMVSRTRNVSNKIICHKSTDHGYTWGAEINLSSGIGTWGGNGVGLVKADNGELFVQAESGTSTYEIGFWRSQDNGDSWSFLSGTTNKTRKWYGAICFNRKDNKILYYGCDQATGTVVWFTQWDIASSTFDFVQQASPTTNYPSHDRAIMGGLACDNRGNVIYHIRVRHSSDSLYRLYEHKWISGSALSTATASLITVGDGAGSQLYGSIQTSRDGTFHKFVTPGASAAGKGTYYSAGHFFHSSSYTDYLDAESGNNSNQTHNYVSNNNDESISEFHNFNLEHDGVSTYSLYYKDDRVKFVGPKIMPMIGG